MMRSGCRVMAMLAVFALGAASAFAQITTGTVFGTVKITSNFRSKKTKRITDRCKTPVIAFSGAV